MRLTLSTFLTLLPGAAFAHSGDIGELAGHDHVIAGIAIGAAVAVAAWGWLKGGKVDEEQVDDSVEPEEAEA